MHARPLSSHARLMLVIAALFAFVTVGFNTASYADGPRRHKISHTVSTSIAITATQRTVSTKNAGVHVPRHLAHQPQILPASGAKLGFLAFVPHAWASISGRDPEGQSLGGLLRPPKSPTA